jgi:heme A synthase
VNEERRTIRHGVIVGLIGYASVALFYSAFDFLASRGTLYTVNLLGKAVFRGLRDPSVLIFPMDLDTGAILRYNVLHLVVALIIGVAATALIAMAERNPSRRGIIRLLIVSGFVITVAIVATLTTPIRPLLPMWSIVAANALAMLLAGAYLVWRRPGLWNRLALAS